ncbi:hypothetical protein [Paratractidigestivibacter sp.]|uniref:division/cell wall cluster transcriptional repressor MraZ n=1 Tax=Paratractidigestivibacter sp. TaxID=2847316 RepID=UPI002ABE043C|nr:hypothetical protein [Paratractidigestivibacter sp.]
MLVGSFPMSVDSKARVTLPATFRKEMCEGDSKTIYLVPMKESVDGFTPAGFEAWIDSLFNKEGEGFDTRSRKDVLLRRSLTSRAVSVDIDSAGRVALGKLDTSKPGTREKYGLTGDVTVIGADDHFEVWNTELWNASQEAIDDELEELLFG